MNVAAPVEREPSIVNALPGSATPTGAMTARGAVTASTLTVTVDVSEPAGPLTFNANVRSFVALAGSSVGTVNDGVAVSAPSRVTPSGAVHA